MMPAPVRLWHGRTVASWAEIVSAEPEFADRVRHLLTSQKHMTLATLRKDGSPRISGTELQIEDGDLWLGMMPRSLKALDLRRDPRLALHGPTVDPPEGAESRWLGEAKVAGHGVEVTEGESPASGHRFRIDITEIVLTRVGDPADHLVIESWHPGRGLEVRRRS
jgi:hypothetical protein